MKDKKSIVIGCLIVFVIKVVFGILTHSYTFTSSAILEAILLTYFLLSNKKESKKIHGLLTSLIGIVIIILSLGITLLCIINKTTKPSFFLILFVAVCVLLKYALTSLKVNTTYNKKIGLLATSNINSTLEFVTYGIVLGSLIITRCGRFWKYLYYGDKLGTVLICLITVYYGLKLIVNSIRYMEDKENVIPEEFIEEINKRDEIKKLESLTVTNYGGLRLAHAKVELKETISLVDINTFAVTLEDYLLKKSDVVEVHMTNGIEKKKNKPKVLSKKEEAIREAKAKKKNNNQSGNKEPKKKNNNQENNKGQNKQQNNKQAKVKNKGKGSNKKNAGNSGSRNSKTGSKKKNNKKNNKKR